MNRIFIAVGIIVGILGISFIGGSLLFNSNDNSDSDTSELEDLLDTLIRDANRDNSGENTNGTTNSGNNNQDSNSDNTIDNETFNLFGEVIDYTRLADIAGSIVSGGPPPDGIPPVDNPKYWSVDQANGFLNDADIVFGINFKGVVLAFPQRVLVWHEIVNEVIDGQRITLSYCPLTGSAIGFHGFVVNATSTFGTSGRLVNSNLVMYDRESGAYWPQILGQAVTNSSSLGINEDNNQLGAKLNKFQVFWTSWGLWKTRYPETFVLSDETGHIRNYNHDPYGSYNSDTSYYQTGSPFFPVMHTDFRLPDKEVVYGIDYLGNQIGVQKSLLLDQKVINTAVGNHNITLFYDSTLDTARVFSRDFNGTTLNITYQAGNFVDNNGNTWNVTGFSDTLDKHLDEVVFFDVMWFAWAAYFPGTDLLQA